MVSEMSAGLLDRAICYALAAAEEVTPQLFRRPTPCAAWDLRALLRHLGDSIETLQDVAGLAPYPAETADPVADLRHRAAYLRCGWPVGDRMRLVDGWPLPLSLLAATGAVEIAVHGWDISRSCGLGRPIPPALAADMLDLTPLVLCGGGPEFAAPVPAPPAAEPGDRLVALLGRTP